MNDISRSDGEKRPSSRLQELIENARNMRHDNYQNLMTGLGTIAADKTQSSVFVRSNPIPDQTLEDMYHGDPLAARVVNLIVDDAFRQGIKVATSASIDADERAEYEMAIMDRMRALDAHSRLKEAAIWGRVFGGGIVLIGADDARVTESELLPESIREIRYLTVMDKRDFQPHTYYADPRSPKFGQVEQYRLQPLSLGASAVQQQGAIIHESRMLIFGGAMTSARERQRLNSWDHSVLYRVSEALHAHGSDWQSVSNMLTDCSQSILKIKGFYETITSNFREQFETRLDLMALAKWVGRIMPLDSEEDYQFVDRTFTGVPDLLDRSMLRASMSSSIPISILFGRSPSGLNATEEHDRAVWYDQVGSYRSDRVGPKYDRLTQLIAYEQSIPEPESWHTQWPSLWQMTPVEEASHRKIVAETDAIYLDAGVLDSAEVRATRFAGDGYSAEAPQVELLAPPGGGWQAEPEPEPEPEAELEPEAEPEPEAELEPSERTDALDQMAWADQIPPSILVDLHAVRAMAQSRAPVELLRRLLGRLVAELGYGRLEIYQDIDAADLKWTDATPQLRTDAFAAWGGLTPTVITDLTAWDVIAKLNAPQSLLRALAERIASGLNITDTAVLEAIKNNDFGFMGNIPAIGLTVKVEAQNAAS